MKHLPHKYYLCRGHVRDDYGHARDDRDYGAHGYAHDYGSGCGNAHPYSQLDHMQHSGCDLDEYYCAYENVHEQ